MVPEEAAMTLRVLRKRASTHMHTYAYIYGEHCSVAPARVQICAAVDVFVCVP